MDNLVALKHHSNWSRMFSIAHEITRCLLFVFVKQRGNKRTYETRFKNFLNFFLVLLFYSRKNIKHSENIFHILRAFQNVLHGFSS